MKRFFGLMLLPYLTFANESVLNETFSSEANCRPKCLSSGPTGPKGEKGSKGERGRKGPQGATGAGLTIATFNGNPVTSMTFDITFPASFIGNIYGYYVTTPDGRTFGNPRTTIALNNIVSIPTGPFYDGHYTVGILLPGQQHQATATFCLATLTSVTTSAGTFSLTDTVALINVPAIPMPGTPPLQNTSVSTTYEYPPVPN